jgi:microcystin degradation protein MlrC
MGPSSGDPLDLGVEVGGVVRDLVQLWPQLGGGVAEIPSGDCAWLRCAGVDIIVGSNRQQTKGLELFTAFGLDPRKYRMLVLKSVNHFQAAYGPIASEVISTSAPGALEFDPTRVPYRRVNRNKFPWTDDPWEGDPWEGDPWEGDA